MLDDEEVTITDHAGTWLDFLETRYGDKLRALIRKYPYEKSLYVSYIDILGYAKTGLTYADRLLSTPDVVLSEIRDAISQNMLLGEITDFHIRVRNLPRKHQISLIRQEDVGKFWSFEGIIRKSTKTEPRLTVAYFRCTNGHTMRVHQSIGLIKEPDRCHIDGCTARKFELRERESVYINSQKVRIEESPEGLLGGAQPETLDIEITDDITGKVKPGDRVIFTGILRSINRSVGSQKSTAYKFYLEANSFEISQKEFSEVHISEEDFKEIDKLSKDPELYRKIVQSIAPSIFGMEEVKEAIALQLFGGNQHILNDGVKTRGDIHLLLMGDPGIAKSQLLHYISQIAPRAIYTSGKGATAAGLTATAVKDDFGDGSWNLEAGALVLADMGLCIVDEIGRMEKHDMSAMHEALEQQSISIAKAGITATLQTRCSLLAAANPKHGRFDINLPLSDQIQMESSLLNRFDLIFCLYDIPERERDRDIAKHILDGKIGKREEVLLPAIPPDLYRKYIAYSKRACIPVISEEAREILIDYYQSVRSLATDRSKPLPITARQLDATIRLSEAYARIRISNEVTEEDAKKAIKILDNCLRSIAYDPDTGMFDVDAVMTGKTKKSRDIGISVEESIRNLTLNGVANEEQVIETVVKQGYDRYTVQKHIENMKQTGKLSAPKNGTLKVVW